MPTFKDGRWTVTKAEHKEITSRSKFSNCCILCGCATSRLPFEETIVCTGHPNLVDDAVNSLLVGFSSLFSPPPASTPSTGWHARDGIYCNGNTISLDDFIKSYPRFTSNCGNCKHNKITLKAPGNPIYVKWQCLLHDFCIVERQTFDENLPTVKCSQYIENEN